jgi:hypothetical protein
MAAISPSPNPARVCGNCSLCCKLLQIAEPLHKPAGRWCSHCRPGRGGCSIYDDRPAVCRAFRCGWLEGAVDDRWHPLRCHLVLMVRDSGEHAHGRPLFWRIIYADPAYANVWHGEPYWGQLHDWALAGLRGYADGDVSRICWTKLMVGARIFILLPDDEVEITDVDTAGISEHDRECWRVVALKNDTPVIYENGLWRVLRFDDETTRELERLRCERRQRPGNGRKPLTHG